MRIKAGFFLGVSVIALISALAMAYVVAFGGEGRQMDNNAAAFTTVTEQPEESNESTTSTSAEDSPKESLERTSEPTTRQNDKLSAEQSEEGAPTEQQGEDAPVESAPVGLGANLPAAMRDAGLVPAQAVCNGKPVLIVESVLDDGSGTQAAARLPEVFAIYPGSVFYLPGACPSLRGVYEGQDVYPVVQEFNSVASLCDAWAARGGNPRLLNDDTSYSSPC